MSYPTIDLPGAGGAEGEPSQGFRLTPLSTGQILDRTFVLYRSRFALFAGLAVFPAAVALLFGLGQVAFLLATHTPLINSAGPQFTTAYLTNQGITLVGLLLRLCVYGISIAASNWCIARIYLGESASMKSGFDFAFLRWFRYVLMGLAQMWFILWLPTLVLMVAVAGLVGVGMTQPGARILMGILAVVAVLGYFVWVVLNAIRVSLAIPACVVEQLSIRAAIRRSRALLVTRKIRIFLMFLFIMALEMVFFAVLVPLAVLIPKMGPNGFLIYQLATLAITFLFGVLVSPIAAISLCLFYFDERVRREGFDIEFLMNRAVPAAPALEAVPVVTEAPPEQ